MKKLSLTPGTIFRLLKKTASEWSNDNAMRLAAALSYYSVFSIAPLLLIAIGMVGIFLGPEAAQGKVAAELGKYIGSQAAQSVQSMVADASKDGGSATATGFAVLLLGASTILIQLKDALNTIWAVKPKPGLGIMGFLRERLMSLSMVLGIGFLLLVSLLMTTAVTALSGWLEAGLNLPKFVSGGLGFVLSFSVETVLFATVFKVLPDAKVQWRNVWSGAVVTALLFEIGKFGLSVYLSQKSTTSSFGAAASIVVLLLWVYYASNILFFGAEFTKVYAAETGEEIKPSEIAQKVPAVDSNGTIPVTAVAAEPHPLSPGAPVPAVPMRESLAPLILSPAVESHALRELRRPTPRQYPEEPKTELERWVRKAHEHPVAEVGAMIGLGFLVGTITRATDKKAPALSAVDHFDQGTRKTAVATKSLALAAAGWLARHLTKRALQEYSITARQKGKKWTHQLANRIEKKLN